MGMKCGVCRGTGNTAVEIQFGSVWVLHVSDSLGQVDHAQNSWHLSAQGRGRTWPSPTGTVPIQWSCYTQYDRDRQQALYDQTYCSVNYSKMAYPRGCESVMSLNDVIVSSMWVAIVLDNYGSKMEHVGCETAEGELRLHWVAEFPLCFSPSEMPSMLTGYKCLFLQP